jgi:hypothetical protein
MLLLASCSNTSGASQSYINSLNSFTETTNVLGSAEPENSKALNNEINAAVPNLQADLVAMQAAQPELDDQAAPIAAAATESVELIITALTALQKAIKNEDRSKAESATAKYEKGGEALQEEINTWNATVASESS